MYAKIFDSIYDGTLPDHWQALVTFQQLLILSDAQGVVDMTLPAIHRRTGIPIEILQEGIAVLEQPDPQSRSKDMDGRRIVRLSHDRDWGWFLVNHHVYRARITAAEKREADRVRIASTRAARARAPDESQWNHGCSGVSQSVAECSGASRDVENVADVAHTEAEAEAEEQHQPLGGGGKTTSRRRAREGVEDPLPESDGATETALGVTRAGVIGRALVAAGIPPSRVNQHTPTFRQVVASDIPAAEVQATAAELAARGKLDPTYILKTVIGRRNDAAASPPIAAKPTTPRPACHEPYIPKRRARDGPDSPPAAFAEIAARLGITPVPPVTTDTPGAQKP